MRIKPVPKTPNLPTSLDDDGGAALIRSLFATFIENNATLNALVNGAQSVAWEAPMLAGSWADFGGGYNPASFCKDLAGFVHLRGMVKGGSGTIFTLPARCRPQYRCRLTSLAGGDAACRIEVDVDGAVVWAGGGTNAFVSLDNLSFEAAE